MSDAPAPTPEPVATPSDADIALAMGARLIRQCEGCTLAPVPDTGTRWEIGYGCDFLADGTAVTAATPPLPDQAAADALLLAMLVPLAARVDRLLAFAASVNQRAALYDFAWNLGVAALAGATRRRRAKAGYLAGAAAQFGAWVHAGGQVLPGLVKRRALERAVFAGEVAP